MASPTPQGATVMTPSLTESLARTYGDLLKKALDKVPGQALIDMTRQLSVHILHNMTDHTHFGHRWKVSIPIDKTLRDGIIAALGSNVPGDGAVVLYCMRRASDLEPEMVRAEDIHNHIHFLVNNVPLSTELDPSWPASPINLTLPLLNLAMRQPSGDFEVCIHAKPEYMSSGMLILAQVTRKPEPPQPPPRVRRTGGRKVAVAPSSSPAASAASCSALAPNGGIRFRPYPPPSTLSAAAPAADKPDGDTTPSSSLIITTTTTTTTAAPLPAATTVIPPSSFLAPPTVPERPHTKLARETAALDRLTRLLDQKEADLVGLRRKAVEASSILDGAKQPLVDFSFANLRARQAIDALKPWIKNPNRFSPLDAEMLERDVQSLDREQEVIKAELERTGLVPM